MGQALYRKYRSRSLQELVGQEHVTQTLANALKEGRISHAYLLTGLRGTGKTSIARILAHEINQLAYDGDTNHLDIIEIDAASNNGVEDVRDLREKVLLAPTSAKYKVYIIDEVHMLSTAAFNALLKTLEEPPEHVVFILATTEVHKLPATIISRTQRYQLQPIPHDKVVAHLKAIAAKEKIIVEDEALHLIADHGEGAFRDSISLLDQLRSVSKEGITSAVVEATLGLAPRKAVEQLVTALQHGKVGEVIQSYEALLGKGIAPSSLAQQLITVLRVLSAKHPKVYELIDKLIEVPRAYNPRLKMEVVLATFALNQADDTVASPPVSGHGEKIARAAPAKTPVEPPVAKMETTQAVASPSVSAPQAPEVLQKVEEIATPEPTTTPAPQPTVQEPSAQAITEPAMPEAPVEAAATAAPHTGPLGELSDELWHQFMEATKESGPTLYTLMRQAIPHFDTEKQLLTITFRYPLHHKRFDEPRHKQEFGKIVQRVWGKVPEMQLILNKNAVRHIKPATPSDPSASAALPADEATNNVMGLMGGGEVVNEVSV